MTRLGAVAAELLALAMCTEVADLQMVLVDDLSGDLRPDIAGTRLCAGSNCDYE